MDAAAAAAAAAAGASTDDDDSDNGSVFQYILLCRELKERAGQLTRQHMYEAAVKFGGDIAKRVVSREYNLEISKCCDFFLVSRSRDLSRFQSRSRKQIIRMLFQKQQSECTKEVSGFKLREVHHCQLG